MKFPGRRKRKHFFPTEEKSFKDFASPLDHEIHVSGLDQLLIDIEISIDDQFLIDRQFPKGQSFLIDDTLASEIYRLAQDEQRINGEFPGGAVGNTLHNYAVLSNSYAYAFGAINRKIELNDYSFKYLSRSSGLVNFDYLMPCDRPMGRSFCFVTPDGERTFAISKGCMNDFSFDYINTDIVKNSAAFLLSAYTFRNETDAIFNAGIKVANLCKEYKVPIFLSLGTSLLVEEKRDFLISYIKDYCSVVSMNFMEAKALTRSHDPLVAIDQILEWCDVVMLTVGAQGLYLGSYCDESALRESEEDPISTTTHHHFNKYEYSRAMKKSQCQKPHRIYTFASPFQGGPGLIKSTNGAGDAALSALLHDASANVYHRKLIPESSKHQLNFLTYSSLSQIAHYANRTSFEVLRQNSARLLKSLPEKEDSLEEAFWSN